MLVREKRVQIDTMNQ